MNSHFIEEICKHFFRFEIYAIDYPPSPFTISFRVTISFQLLLASNQIYVFTKCHKSQASP